MEMLDQWRLVPLWAAGQMPLATSRREWPKWARCGIAPTSLFLSPPPRLVGQAVVPTW